MVTSMPIRSKAFSAVVRRIRLDPMPAPQTARTSSVPGRLLEDRLLLSESVRAAGAPLAAPAPPPAGPPASPTGAAVSAGRRRPSTMSTATVAASTAAATIQIAQVPSGARSELMPISAHPIAYQSASASVASSGAVPA